MKFMLLVRVLPDADPTPEEADPTAWDDDATRRGILLERDRLCDPSDATTVRVRNGKTLVTDGPFAEFKEYIAGYGLLEADAVDDVVALAKVHPVASFGSIEIREVWEFAPAADDPDARTDNPVTGAVPAADSGTRRVQYLLIHAHDGDGPTGVDRADHGPTEWVAEMEARGVCRSGYRLRPADEAQTVRVRGTALVTRGPYTEVHEQVAGYDLIEAADLDEAIEIAAKHPTARHGAVEIRPLWQL